jgi:hypothetical protein
VTKGNRGRPPKEDLNPENFDPGQSNFASKSDPMTHSTALYYQRKLEKEERFKKIIGQQNISNFFTKNHIEKKDDQ